MHKDWCLHKDTKQWLEIAGNNEPWITIYKSSKEQTDSNEEAFIWSFLIKPDSITDELSNYCFNQFDGYPCTDKFEIENVISYYSRFGHEDREPLFFRRRFTGKVGYLELSQEFVHFFQLYYDKFNEKYIRIHEDGSEDVVVEIKNGTEIRVSLRHLKQYLAFKNVSLILGVVIQRFFNEPINGNLAPTNTKPVTISQTDNHHYAVWYQQGFNKWQLFTELIGKKVIHPMPIERTGIYPFEQEQQYMEFIIGQDSDGNKIDFTCKPDSLSNNFGKNAGKPHYLTPIYFSKQVLTKYYSDSRIYSVEDGIIRIGDFSLRADTNHPELVVVFLGDLGRDIPFSEQQYWKSFNIVPTGEMSKTAISRSFLGNFADPESEQFILINKYNRLQELWTIKFGWVLFKPMNKDDEYRLKNIRVPLSENQQEFDQQVESLVVILIDSINKKEIDNLVNISDPKIRQIKSLELFCKKNQFEGYEEHIDFLHQLYKLRSLSASHRKDTKDYPKLREKFEIDKIGHIQAFKKILARLILLLEFFISCSTELGE